MGKTSISTVDKVVKPVTVVQTGGDIAVVLNAKRGRTDRVYSITSVEDLIRIYGDDVAYDYMVCKYLLSRGNGLRVVACALPEVQAGTANAKATKLVPFAEVGETGITFTAVSSGAAYNNIKLTITNQLGVGANNVFSLNVYDGSVLLERFPLVSINPDSAYYYGATVKSDVISISGNSSDDSLFTSVHESTYGFAITVTLAGGVGIRATLESANPTLLSLLTASATLLSDKSIGFATALAPLYTGEDVWTIYSPVVAARKNFVVLIDTANITVDTVINDDITPSAHSAVYYPDVNIPYLGGFVHPSVAVADLVANMHRNNIYYKAPAGVANGVLKDVTDVKQYLTNAEITNLQLKNINPIVVRTDLGVLLWGQSCTNQAITDIDRLSVEFLVNYLKRRIYTLSVNYIFADNNQETWTRWLNDVDPILRGIESVNGLQKYALYCGTDTMTDADIQNGILRGKVLIQPNKQVETIEIVFTVDETGVAVE